jgi:hypothetical protein
MQTLYITIELRLGQTGDDLVAGTVSRESPEEKS